MLKRIIFDLDYTLIYWKDEYPLLIKEILKKHNINVDYRIIDEIIESMEVKYETLSKDILLRDVQEKLNDKITMDIIDEIFEGQKKLSDYDENLIELLKYLSSKYEIVVLSNYFTSVQKGRLEHAGLLPYISEVYGGDMIPKFKPDASGFIKAMGNHLATECLVIGDSVRCDINGALNVGIPAILYDSRGKYPDYQGKKINSLYELKEML